MRWDGATGKGDVSTYPAGAMRLTLRQSLFFLFKARVFSMSFGTADYWACDGFCGVGKDAASVSAEAVSKARWAS